MALAEAPHGNGVKDLVPRPDPTDRTEALVERATAALREIIQARLDAMDKATVLLDTQRIADIKHLRELHQEKFASVDQQLKDAYTGMTLRFTERDTRSSREATDNKTAVDAAFAAQKEAVGEQNKSFALATAKSEAATTKQIDAMGLAVDSKFKATDDKIDDIKARLDRGEGQGAGQRIAQVDNRNNNQWVIGTFVAVAVVVLAIVQVVLHFIK